MLQNDKKILRHIKKARKETDLPSDAPVHEILLEYSTKVDQKTFDKTVMELQKDVTDEMTDIKTKYQNGVAYVRSIKNEKDKLFGLFNSFCEKAPAGYNNLDTVYVTSVWKPEQKREIRKVINRKGVKFQNYVLVFDDKYRGIWMKDGRKWKNIVSDCDISNKVIKDFCKVKDKKADKSVFCSKVLIDALDLREYNKHFINNIKIGKPQQISDLLPI